MKTSNGNLIFQQHKCPMPVHHNFATFGRLGSWACWTEVPMAWIFQLCERLMHPFRDPASLMHGKLFQLIPQSTTAMLESTLS